MAVFTPSQCKLPTDHRWRKWAKLIRSPEDINLGKLDGYSLTGQFADWDKAVPLAIGQFLLCAAETGSAKYRSYDYRLMACGDDDTVVAVDEDTIDAYISSRLDRLSDGRKAALKNSELYGYAVYCSFVFEDRTAAASGKPVESAALQSLRKAWAKMTDEERAAFIAEMAR